MQLSVVILAAGKGERMRSNKPKVMHEIMGKPMVGYAIERAQDLSPKKTVVVLGYGKEFAEGYVKGFGVTCVTQKGQKGTAHALLSAEKSIRGNDVLVLYGDVRDFPIDDKRRVLAARAQEAAEVDGQVLDGAQLQAGAHDAAHVRRDFPRREVVLVRGAHAEAEVRGRPVVLEIEREQAAQRGAIAQPQLHAQPGLHAVSSRLAWGQTTTNAWYLAPAIPCLVYLVFSGLHAVPIPRLASTASMGFLLICLACELVGQYHTMPKAYTFRAIGDGALERLASLQTWWLGSPTLVAAVAVETLLLGVMGYVLVATRWQEPGLTTTNEVPADSGRPIRP